MDQVEGDRGVELGRYLAEIRERAGMRQADLARQITLSPAVVSRIESGERPIAPEELSQMLAAIGTPEARRLEEVLRRAWKVLPRPPLSHPEQDYLWEAERVAQRLTEAGNEPGITGPFQRRLSEYIAELRRAGGLLLKREHQIAFIGAIGVGKSTAICRLTKLELPSTDSAPPTPVLEAGAGGTTICEVQIRRGPAYGLLVDPRSDEELRADVQDFVDHLTRRTRAETDDDSGGTEGVSREIERAIRNMAGLTVQRPKSPEGEKRLRIDPAQDLAARLPSPRDLVVEFLARMNLHRRDRRDAWYDPSCGRTPLEWLAQTFEQVNNGRHADFGLPKRIEVVVPHELIESSDMPITVIDTKGVDQSVARGDVERHLDDPHTLAVLCCLFNDAPGSEPRVLLERAQRAGVRSIGERCVILVLPRARDALAVKDDDGGRVSRDEDGYEIKSDQIALALEPLRVGRVQAVFFNAFRDDPSRLRESLRDRFRGMRQRFRERLATVTAEATRVLDDQAQEQARESVREVGRMLGSWARQHAEVPEIASHIHDALMSQLRAAHASTIHATVRREGEWPTLQYSYQLGYGARWMAASVLTTAVSSFADLCKTMSGSGEYDEVRPLIEQASRVLEDAHGELLRRVQLTGQTTFSDALRAASEFWVKCGQEWGRGPGYKERVAKLNAEWFQSAGPSEIEQEVRASIEREWASALARVTALLEEQTR